MQIEKPLTEQNCDGSIDKFHSILVAQNFDGLVHAKVVHELIDYHLKAVGSVELGHRLLGSHCTSLSFFILNLVVLPLVLNKNINS